MKHIFTLLLLLTLCVSANYADDQVDAGVYVCTGPKSQCYHRTDKCRGLNDCTSEVKQISKSEAETLGRRKCNICYKD